VALSCCGILFMYLVRYAFYNMVHYLRYPWYLHIKLFLFCHLHKPVSRTIMPSCRYNSTYVRISCFPFFLMQTSGEFYSYSHFSMIPYFSISLMFFSISFNRWTGWHLGFITTWSPSVIISCLVKLLRQYPIYSS